MNVPRDPNQLDAKWLSGCLREAGVLRRGDVSGVRVEPFAEGLGVLGRLVRLHLMYSEPDPASPRTLVAKFPSLSEANLGLAHGMHLYEREIYFYEDARARTPFVVPRAFFSHIDAAHRFVLVMEDLSETNMCDQVAGATADELVPLVTALARHHAAFWGKVPARLVRFDDPTFAATIGSIYHAAVGPALERFGDRFSPELRDAALRLDGQIGALWSRLCKSPTTMVHGDFRLDNLGFARDGQVVCFDWQISGLNTGPYDLGFLLSQSVDPEVRAPVERDLVRRYHQTLLACGVRDYAFETCWEDYRRTVMVCLIYPVIVCGLLDVSNERGRRFGEASLDRSLSAVEALQATTLLE